MKIDFHKGFNVHRSLDNNLVFIAPHSGPSIETPTSRDDHSETVASLCWLDTGGSLITVSCSRKPLYGIDFNRMVPEKEMPWTYTRFFRRQ